MKAGISLLLAALFIGARGAMKRAKNEAREKASDMGATHVVFTSVYGGYGGSAAAKAYRCR
jgi:hypothetical protein